MHTDPRTTRRRPLRRATAASAVALLLSLAAGAWWAAYVTSPERSLDVLLGAVDRGDWATARDYVDLDHVVGDALGEPSGRPADQRDVDRVIRALRGRFAGGRVRETPEGSGRTYVVSTGGSDRADGSAQAPWRTIQHAADQLRAGDRLLLRAGSYDERPVLVASGSSSAAITIESYPGEQAVVERGLSVVGDHYRISRILVAPGLEQAHAEDAVLGQYDIEGDHNVLADIAFHGARPRSGTDIPVLALKGSDNAVRGVEFRDCGNISFVGTGMGRTGLGVRNIVDGGTITRADDAFAVVSADHATLANLDMHDSGQVNGDGDADGIQVDGVHVAIRNNRIHGVHRRNEEQHTDAIQWWNMADDLVIEGNVIGSFERGPLGLYDEGHIQFETFEQNSVTGAGGMSSNRVIVRDNVFLNAGEYYVINAAPESVREGAADDWQIVNNTFRCPQQIRGDLATVGRDWVIARNIFFGDGPDYQGADDWTIDGNAYVGAESPQDGHGSLERIRPEFAQGDVSEKAEYGAASDWRLEPGSPLAGRGARRAGPRVRSETAAPAETTTGFTIQDVGTLRRTDGGVALASLRLRGGDGTVVELRLKMRRHGMRWRVVAVDGAAAWLRRLGVRPAGAGAHPRSPEEDHPADSFESAG